MGIQEQERFNQAVEHLYIVFQKYPLRSNTEMCPCCHDKEDELRLHRKPLRELSAEDLERYGWSALLTWGTDEGFKHFLPRMFELVPEADSGLWPDSPVVFAKLRLGEWQSWPANEQAAVNDYLKALWRLHVTDVNEDRDLDDILCGIAHAVDDLTPFLKAWLAAGPAGHYTLSRFIADEFNSIVKKRKLSNAFWRDEQNSEYEGSFQRDRTAQMNQVIEWLLSPVTKDAMEEMYFGISSHPLAADIAAAVDSLEYLAKLYPPDAEKSREEP